ncbi:UCH-binding domain,26S proteasome complex ubiquitin receptor, subunit Rpn13 [Cinara cedri]|uniref:Proteasomal ubiquitin receptor ADRM1 homolog n=1 Tax=Cinara cedri TaxID=506608 RepID=A0A5E4MF97_9HEMI|nr:UCH-binding domain,26S proteasome complex ubiquitin receptor, subunit Rpn13 [Cinara cedri]
MSGATALFGNTTGRNQSKNLVEFRAGKMSMRGKTVYPDKRKGLVYIHQSDDSLIHFCWKDRTTGAVEDDLIIFPDDCEFKFVSQCTTGRVYVLKFKSSSKKQFFWLQEPSKDKDEENCRRVNDVMNNPPAPGSNRSGGTTPDGDLQNLLSNMSQQQLMQLFGGVGQIGGLSSLLGTMRSSQTGRSSSSTQSSSAQPTNTSSSTNTNTGSNRSTSNSNSPPPTSSTSTSSAESQDQKLAATGIQLRDLQSMLSGLTGAQGTTDKPAVDLSAAMDLENLESVIDNKGAVNQLAQHLPTTESDPDYDHGLSTRTTPDELKETILSPQFRQAVSMFSNALQTGQLGSVVQQFDLGAGAVSAANQGNMEEFVRALQQTNINAEESEDVSPVNPEKRKKPDNDDIGSK